MEKDIKIFWKEPENIFFLEKFNYIKMIAATMK